MMKNSLKKKTNKKGFTLVELVMVVALIAILAAIAVPTVSNVIDTANKNVDLSNAQTIELTLKTADAEIKSGIQKDLTSSSTVVDVLAKYGITIDITAAGKSGATFKYKDKKVVLSTDASVTGASDFVKGSTNPTKLSDFIGS
ncbi:MAG TPA: prepilin-type N-terminal cleavage/methylation domain-containing protein [Ruminiclostridium sp.]|nr:prepilin-type N-terminal cleavage/methylation domain-containing protein [Ruminiclostridium sp.]